MYISRITYIAVQIASSCGRMRSWGGPTSIHGYSNEYPRFLNKKYIYMKYIFHMYI